MTSIPLSILDLAIISAGETVGDGLAACVRTAQVAEASGYRRVWYAEHHNMDAGASSATAVLIAPVAANTSTIRLGSGGIMLPNHSPLVIAEQFGTLAALHPGRIDLGLGRAPGTDQRTMTAMRRDPRAAETFPQDVLELQGYLSDESRIPGVNATPGRGTHVTLYILGSSLFGAELAGLLGLPFGFASHFAPSDLDAALRLYKQHFKPSAQLERSHSMPCINVIVADTDREAAKLFTTLQQRFTDMARNRRGLMSPPIDDIETYWSPAEKAHAMRMLECAFVGSPESVRRQLQAFIERTGADELMVSGSIFDHDARLRSYQLPADIGLKLEPRRAAALATA
jgi:luciferase family oxidoreductase group 1